MLKNKKYSGIIYTLIIWCIFFGLSYIGMQKLDGSAWEMFRIAVRIIFGTLILLIFRFVYSRKPSELFKPVKTKDAVISGSPFIIYLLYFLLVIITGFSEFNGLTVQQFFAKIILQQTAAVFFEEILFRALLLEGFFFFEKRTWKTAAVFLLIDFFVFGSIHIYGGIDPGKFFLTGVIGISMSVIYLRTRNIIVPMSLHFLYNIEANLENYITLKNTNLFLSVFSLFDFFICILAVGSLVLMFRDDPEIKKILTGKNETA